MIGNVAFTAVRKPPENKLRLDLVQKYNKSSSLQINKLHLIINTINESPTSNHLSDKYSIILTAQQLRASNHKVQSWKSLQVLFGQHLYIDILYEYSY